MSKGRHSRALAVAIAWMMSGTAWSQDAAEDLTTPGAVPPSAPEATASVDRAEQETRLRLETIVAGDHRSDEQKARDKGPGSCSARPRPRRQDDYECGQQRFYLVFRQRSGQ